MLVPIILADYPWKYDNEQSGDTKRGAATYPKMTPDELMLLPIRRILAKNGLFFGWWTGPKQEVAAAVMRAYKLDVVTWTVFSWLKLNKNAEIAIDDDGTITIKGGIRSGQGYYTNQNQELVFVARDTRYTRVPIIDRAIKQWVIEPIRDHSRKPDEIRRRIERMVGLKGLELFAREWHDDGWIYLGNDVDGLDIRQSLQVLHEAQDYDDFEQVHRRFRTREWQCFEEYEAWKSARSFR